MNGISISMIELLIKGVPEGLLMVLALHLFTRTKIDWNKYFLISLIYIILTYVIRFLPITLGVNTMLCLLAMILIFQLAYKAQLAKVVRSIASAVIMMTLVMISEVLNVLLLYLLFGQAKTEELLNLSTSIMKSISTIPSTIFTAIFILLGNLILLTFDKRKKKYGETCKKTGE